MSTDLRARLLAHYKKAIVSGDLHSVRDQLFALIDSLCELREAMRRIDENHGMYTRSTLEDIAQDALAASDARLGKFVGGE